MLLMPLLLSGPISAAIDRFPRFPLLAVGTVRFDRMEWMNRWMVV
jgi:hypothetical protein